MVSGDAISCERETDIGSDVEWISIAELVLRGSPRSAGEDADHALALAELEPEAELPPIVVQRGTNRVIDGMHRVRAAQLRGERAIRVRYFDGDDAGAFVLAVRLNVRHGLPLSLADRKSAVLRILREHPGWSNRAVAEVVGLSPKTVGALRGQCGAPVAEVRIGRDGRVRPVSAASGRERAREILLRDPTSSLRTVSAAAGVSPGTVRAVRMQLNEQATALIPEQRAAEQRAASPKQNPDPRRARGATPRPAGPDRTGAMLRALRSDPSLRFNESGRLLLSVLAVAEMDARTRERLVGDLPDHCVEFVAELAEASGQAWQELAKRLAERRCAAAGSK
ncbi:ParB and winged helix-turn-helix domain-containing protein [Microbispora sp. H10670]|uniref:ParB and winged helix-turn-helix domain-containing protein n=1 Tax=Microbispora sp. H10670 TaxID=2729108 RepID=UPI001C71D06D|nr:ParB N-terminal domain-containing protein [Microbispora sp. H10670]